MQTYLKAVYAALSLGLGSLAVAYADNVVTNQEWVTITLATLGGAAVVWGVPNKPSS